MTTEVTPTEALQNWWAETEFPGKSYCELRENGELILKSDGVHPQRTLAHVTLENADAAVKALIEKFPEVESRFRELEQEWHQTEDKLKLAGKVSRLHEYLSHVHAIGDFAPMLAAVAEWSQVVNASIEANYVAKLELVKKAETLSAEVNTNWKVTSQLLKDLGEQWKQVGFVDKDRNDQLWNRLEAARNTFFDRKRKFQEDQEREMLANLDLKLELIERAEALANSEQWKDTSETYRKLMEEWKSIGRTMHEKNEELWNRLLSAKNTFYDRKKAHFESIQAEQEANYALKLALVEKAETLKESTEWNKTTQAFNEINDEWKKIGRVPQEKSDEIWKRLNDARDHFFQNRRQYQEHVKVALDDNYAQKRALLKRAEELKHSTNWREATEEMNELFDEWKKIGRVPKEQAQVWDEFIAARKFFFERKDADRERRKQQVEKQFEQKLSKTRSFLNQLETELGEERERLEDFRAALQNITPGNKEEELRSHLTKLISQSETKINHKTEKIADISRQLAELEQKKDKKETKQEQPAPQAEATTGPDQ